MLRSRAAHRCGTAVGRAGCAFGPTSSGSDDGPRGRCRVRAPSAGVRGAAVRPAHPWISPFVNYPGPPPPSPSSILELANAKFERLELLSGAGEHRALNVEFLALHQVHSGDSGRDDCANVPRHVLSNLVEPGWQARLNAAGKVCRTCRGSIMTVTSSIGPAAPVRGRGRGCRGMETRPTILDRRHRSVSTSVSQSYTYLPCPIVTR